jgi:hypothetical protein
MLRVLTQKELVAQIKGGATHFPNHHFRGDITLNFEELGFNGDELCFRGAEFGGNLTIEGGIESLCLKGAKVAGSFDRSAARVFELDDTGLVVSGDRSSHTTALPGRRERGAGDRSARA